MKKIITSLVCIVMFASFVPYVSAYTYPQAIWSVNPKLEAAVNSGDNAGIAEFAGQIIDIMSGEPDCEEVRSTLVSKYRQMGNAQMALGDYAAAANTFERLYNYASQFGDQYYDDVRMSKERMRQYKPVLTMYTEGGTAPYYGVKNEKTSGILFGVCEDSEGREFLPEESMLLLYQELGYDVMPYSDNVMKKASEAGLAVEFALNCPNEGSDIADIQNKTSNLQQISDLLAKYPSVPVFLRFGAEFDVWTNMTDGESFKNAYRFVADFFRSRNSNVAMVWSPNQVSAWNVNIDDYYPGDEYVDWVGVSLYARKYFSYEYSENDNNEVAFRTGDNTDPVIAIQDIVEKYGSRKPIMISESGCEHYNNALGENMTDWAIKRLREYYAYLPMVYPQIKLMAYFDHYRDGDEHNYSLFTNDTMMNEYKRLVSAPVFIKDKYENNATFCYTNVWNSMTVPNVFSVSSYVHLYKEDISQVNYYIDDNYVATSNSLPFTAYIDASGYSGTHTLKAVATGTNGSSVVSERTINISPASYSEIGVYVSDTKVEFDQTPVIFNSRTMVPVRKIFESLGAEVEWDASTQTAIGRKDGRVIRIPVGSGSMYVDNERKDLDAPAIILSERTLVPARAVAEALDCQVDWDAATATVKITQN